MSGLIRYSPDQYGRMLPDPQGDWLLFPDVQQMVMDALEKNSENHDAALRRAKAEVWREAEKEARREAGNPGNTGDYQLACRYLAEVYNARAAQIEEGE